jgi:gliding motility-associated-like protein
MKKRGAIFLILFLSGILCLAQNPVCSDGYVYMDGGTFIKYYDPSMPLSSTNPAPTNIPTFGGGLALMPNINGGTLTPTFYTTSGGNYWYWSGVSWVNTGHSTGNGAAVNIAGCGGTIYNLVGSSGQVYSYNGTSNGTLLTTLQGFNGGGPYDLVTDCNCNFYALKTSTPNQGLIMYSPTGSVLCTYSLSGMTNSSAGGGFAIIGNKVYLKNNGAPGFHIGTISGGVVTFSAVTGFTNSPGDFASCSVCYPSTSLAGSGILGGALSCTIPSVNLIVTTTASPVTYSWVGPGIIGAANGSVVSVNAAGTYSCFINTATCPPSQVTLTTAVTSNSNIVTAVLTPSGTVCVEMNASEKLKVAHTSTSDAVFWNGPSSYFNSGIDSVIVSQPGTYTVNVVDITSGCTATDVVTIHQTPTVSIALTDNTICLQGYNSSPATLTITPSGALNYTLLTGFNFSTTAPNGPVMPCFPITVFGNLSSQATPTLIGSDGVCSDTTQTSFSIIANPELTLSATSASICPNTSTLLIASGADQYLWGGSTGLNTYLGSNVVAAPNVFSMYTVIGTSVGCQSQTYSVTVSVLPLPTLTISPISSTICLGAPLTLSVNGTATSFTWTPAIGILSSINGASVNVSPPNSLIYSAIGSLNSCTTSVSASVQIQQPPILSLALSSPTLCAQNLNNSPNSILLVPSGASSYTLLADPGISIGSPNGPIMQATHSSSLASGPSVFTATLSGKTGVCNVDITKSFTVIPNPVLAMSPASASACPGESRAFSVSGANSYTWLPKPNYTVTSNSGIVANPSLTSFYSVIGSDNGCMSAIKNAVLLVLPIPEVTVAPKTNTVCAGNTVVINAYGNATSYQWSPPATLSSSSGSQVTASPLAYQTYTVKATLNTCTNQAVSSVSVIQIPNIHASSPQPTICSSANTILNVTGADSFLWFPNETLNSKSGDAVVASPNQSTTYTVHGYNGICTGSTTIHIQTVKRPNMDLIVSENKLCIGQSLPIIAIGADTYTWSPINTTIPSGTDSMIIAYPQVSTNYTVYGSTNMGTVSCYQQLSYSVTVVPNIIPLVSGNAEICIGDKTTLSASGGNSFSWTPSEGLNVTNKGAVLASPKITTVYTVEVSEYSACGKTTTVMVSVNPKPEVYAGRDTSYNLNEAIFVNAVGTGTLTWVRGEDIVCLDCPYTQVYPRRNGCYLVQAVNDFGCAVTDEVCIQLTEDFTVYIPNTFSPNNDGKNDQFLIFGENISDISMEIYNRWGVKIFYSDDFKQGWDGKYKDAICPVGAYTYVIRYTGLDRKKYTKTGNVNLIK